MTKIAGRYEVKAKLGEGGMGVVYLAYDPPPMDREVAVKTLHEFEDPMALELFYKECSALKSISHPNIVEIFDMGESEPGGKGQPFFVMPLLPGQTLDELIRKASHRLTVDRVVEIFAQTCRGLQAAHERGLVHRDLKPSNIFVMADDSVKIIDFGVAHAVHAKTRTTGYQKGTLLYMSPEQVQHKPVSVQSDVYSLGVTLYEALTRRQPFRNATEDAVIQAILAHIPPPASDLNPAVSHVISRVVHKAMAKQPWNRFDSARDLGETLLKAYRNEPIAIFDSTRLLPRIQTATKALEKGDYQFAGEIISELEAEGNIDPQITLLRAEIDQIARQKTVAQLIESARARYEEQEDPLALQKLQEVLQLDPTNVSALGLKSKIEDRRSERQIEQWIQLAQQHASNRSYGHAREALQNALVLRPKDARASRLLKEIETEEQDYMRLRKEKTELYQAAVNAWKNGEVSQALSQMKIVLDLDRRAPDATSPDASSAYQSFFNKIRSEHESMNSGYAEARRCLAEKDFGKALEICRTFLEKYPGQALFQALKFDIDEQQRQRLSAFIADVDRRLEAEADIDAKLSLVREAAGEFPEEDHFKRLVKLLDDKRDLVNSIVERAKLHESAGQITEALSDLETLRTIYGAYPGLKFEKERLQKRLEQQTRDSARAAWVRQIDAQLQTGDYVRGAELLDKADIDFPGDAELAELRKLVAQGADRTARADQLVAEGQQLCAEGQFEQGVDLLKIALDLDDRNSVRMTLRDLLVGRAQETFEADWRAADGLVEHALELDPNHALAKSLRARALDKRREEEVGQVASQARRLQADGEIAAAMAEVDKGLASYPADTRLNVIKDALQKELAKAPPPPAASAAPPPEPLPGAFERTRIVEARTADEPAAPASPGERTKIVPRTEPPVSPSGTRDARTTTPKPPAPPRKPLSPAMMWGSIAAVAIVAVGLWMFLSGGSAPAPAPPEPARLVLRGQPAGTEYFDGSTRLGAVAENGAAEFQMSPGSRSLRFELAGHLPVSIPREFVAGQPVELTGAEVQFAPLPAVTATLRVRGLPSGTRVLLDDQEIATLGRDSAFESTSVPPGDNRSLRFELAGQVPVTLTRSFTADQPVEITEKDVVFRPAPSPAPGPTPAPPVPAPSRSAKLRLMGFPPETRVQLDGSPIGTVGADGTLSLDNVAPKTSTIQFLRPGFDPAVLTRTFAAGGTVTIAGSEVTMTKPLASIQFVTPPGTGVTIRQSGKMLQQFVYSSKVTMPEGQYEIVSKGPAGVEMTDPLTVAPGETRTVPVRIVGGIERFTGWGNKDGWFYRRQQTEGVVIYQDTSSEGRFTFTVRRLDRRGNQFSTADRLRWVVGYIDGQNYIMCEIDRDAFYRYELRNGVKVKESERRVPHAIPPGTGFVHFTVQTESGALVVSYDLGTRTWPKIDTWNLSASKTTQQAITKGRFGFSLKANEELWIQNFLYYPPSLPR